MPTYRYKAADTDGRILSGEIHAETEPRARYELDGRGLVPLSVKPAADLASRFKSWRGGPKWKIEEKVHFTQKFASLIKAGIPLLTALGLVAKQTRNRDARDAIVHIGDQVASGKTLHEALYTYSSLFDSVYLGAVNAGEATGRLDSVLQQTAAYLEREMNTRRRVKEAFRYPVMVVAAIGIAGLLILKFVVPQFMSVYAHFGADLPTPTRILMTAADIIDHIWWFLPIGVVAIWGGWKYLMRSDEGRMWRDTMLLKLPIVGTLFLKVAVSRFARLFGVLFSAGLPVTASLETAADGVGNQCVGVEVTAMRQRISSGGNIADRVEGSIIPELVYEMLSIGFETGEVERMLGEVARHYDQEIEYDVRRLSDRLQPVILVVLAAAVLTMALAVLMPMWNLITLIK